MINCENSEKRGKVEKSSLIDQTPERKDNQPLFGSSKPAGTAPAPFFDMVVKAAPEDEKKTVPAKKKVGSSTKGLRKLTVAEKAEIASLYRTGVHSVAELAKKYKKAPVTITKVIKDMGVKKGEAVEVVAKRLSEAIESRAVTDTEEILRKLMDTKRQSYAMNHRLQQLIWGEIARCKSSGIDVSSVKDVIATLKMAGEAIAGARKEIYAVLNADRFDQERTMDELPELTVRELTSNEITHLQGQVEDNDLGLDMVPEDGVEGL